MSKPHNPAAFPGQPWTSNEQPADIPGPEDGQFQSGMTLRDYFAIRLWEQAKADLIHDGEKPIAQSIAAQAYFLADEMLRARQA